MSKTKTCQMCQCKHHNGGPLCAKPECAQRAMLPEGYVANTGKGRHLMRKGEIPTRRGFKRPGGAA